jgi:two-component system, OmpR family, response regulator
MDAPAPWPSFRVLCVDDNGDYRDCADSTVLLLRTVGFEALACYDGPTALRMVEKFLPSICFLDLNMPGMAGDEVAMHICSLPWCPILLVALTAMSNEQSRARTAAAGFHLHLVKPVDPQKLIEVVDTLFRQAELARTIPQEPSPEPIADATLCQHGQQIYLEAQEKNAERGASAP